MTRPILQRNDLYRFFGRLCPPSGALETRVCGRLQRWLPPTSRRPVRAGNGFLVTGDTSNVAYLTGLHEREYMESLGGLIGRGQTVYDVGANTGYLALWLWRDFAVRGSEVGVVAFEPEPRTVGWLRENVELNSAASDVQVEAIALGASSGELTLWSVGRGDGSVSADPAWAARPDRAPVQVPVETIDSFCDRGGAKAPDRIVLDVEGFGHDVIAGAKRVIAAHGPAVAAEIHTETEHEGIASPLRQAGYRVTHETTSGWGRHIIWQRS